jgi:hypothetical protein
MIKRCFLATWYKEARVLGLYFGVLFSLHRDFSLSGDLGLNIQHEGYMALTLAK